MISYVNFIAILFTVNCKIRFCFTLYLHFEQGRVLWIRCVEQDAFRRVKNTAKRTTVPGKLGQMKRVLRYHMDNEIK